MNPYNPQKPQRERRKDSRITVWIERDTLDLLQTVALREQRSLSAVVRDAVKRLSIERIVYDFSK